MKAEKISTTYQVEMTIEDYKAFNKNDFLDVVMPRLAVLCATDIEYDGHLGAMVQFSIEPDKSTGLVVDEIAKLIAEGKKIQQKGIIL